MKKLIFISVCLFLMNLCNCFSQLAENNNKVFESETKFVYGYSNDFIELDLGVTFGKVISIIDTSYYIKFLLHAPNSEFRKDIQINKTHSITFLSKNGKKVELNLSDLVALAKFDVDTYNEFLFSNRDSYYSTDLVLNVSKDKLIEIGSEPFYRIIFPYYNSTYKVEDKAIFVRPMLPTPRTFTQKSVKYILNI